MADPALYASPVMGVREDDCYFYHVMDVPGHDAVGGQFDLRGREDEYLGNIELAGTRVLEIGPASGFLSFHMESKGARVVAVELAPDVDWDIVPQAGLDLAKIRADRRAIMRQLRNGFWWAHERAGSAVQVHYGDVYSLPDELGGFDIAVMAAVLRHTRHPLQVVEECALRADRLVIAEMHMPELDDEPVARLVPARESGTWDTWWDFSPGFLARFLGVLGFGQISVTHHGQRYLADEEPRSVPFFTLVAEADGGHAERA
ncbi:MAG TPA: class I SAM-dependent methyltransferase [Solirubrobacteraceae bacterium]